jgi:hypothetical protein
MMPVYRLREWELHEDGLSDVTTVNMRTLEVTAMLSFFFERFKAKGMMEQDEDDKPVTKGK